jgi:hypothetical protein
MGIPLHILLLHFLKSFLIEANIPLGMPRLTFTPFNFSMLHQILIIFIITLLEIIKNVLTNEKCHVYMIC